MKNTVKQHTF